MPGQQNGFDVNAARQAGYSDDEILAHLTQTRNFDVNAATQAGYSKADMIGYLASTQAGPRPSTIAEQQAFANPPRATFNIPKSPLEMVGGGVGDEAQGNAQMGQQYMTAGPGEIGGGLKDVAQGNVSRGLHRAIKGAGVTAIPATATLAPIAAASAPVPFFLSALMGTGGGIAAQKGAQYLGASQDQSDLAGDIGALAGGYGGYKAGDALQDSGVNNFLASKMRYPATARQSQLGRPGTIKPVLPSFLQKYTIPDWTIPTGDVGTPTNPGWFADLPARMPAPPAPETPIDPVAAAVRGRTAAWLPTRIKPAAVSEPSAPSPFQGMMSTSPQSVSGLPPVSIGPEAPAPEQPNVQFVQKFAPQKSVIQDPNSPPPNVRVTYQSVPQDDLFRMVMGGDRQAILEWQRRGLQLPSNVGYMVESGAGNLPWRRYKR